MQSQPETVLLDCCRVADRLPLAAFAQELAIVAPSPRMPLQLSGQDIARLLYLDDVPGQALMYPNGCVVCANLDRQTVQALLLRIAKAVPNANFEQMMRLREIRSVPLETYGNTQVFRAQAQTLCTSMLLEMVEHRMEALLDEIEQKLVRSRRALPARSRGRRREVAKITALRYACLRDGLLNQASIKWDMAAHAAFEQLSQALDLDERKQAVAEKLNRLEDLVTIGFEVGQRREGARQLWLEIGLLTTFPMGHLLHLVSGEDGLLNRIWRLLASHP